MIQLIFHLIGDYMTQNQWMAKYKANETAKGYVACLIHCVLYTIPFGIYYSGQHLAIFTIFMSHFLIDKYRLAIPIIKLNNWQWDTALGFSEDTPQFMAVWLFIIIDNTMHIVCNYLALTYLK